MRVRRRKVRRSVRSAASPCGRWSPERDETPETRFGAVWGIQVATERDGMKTRQGEDFRRETKDFKGEDFRRKTRDGGLSRLKSKVSCPFAV